MSGFIVPNDATTTLSIQPVDAGSSPVSIPSGTTFSAFTSDASIATASANTSSGVTTVTPNSSVTGIVYVTVVGTLTDSSEISGCIDLHTTTPGAPVPDRLVISPE